MTKPPIKKKPVSQSGKIPNLGKPATETPPPAEPGAGALATLPPPEDLSDYLALIELALQKQGWAIPYWEGERKLWQVHNPTLLPGLYQLALRSIQKQDGLDEVGAAELLLEQGDRTRNHIRLYLNHLTPAAIKGLALRYAEAADLRFPQVSIIE
ncbi:MAG: hypothetical protein ACFB0C_15550 [Leptolyngbyaceae cyanobacterium]